MNFAQDDIHRSLRRYVTWLLPDVPVWTQRAEIRDDARPVGVVEPAGPSTTLFARSSIPQGDVQKTRPWSLMLYPALAATRASHASRPPRCSSSSTTRSPAAWSTTTARRSRRR
jgi:hypothetical protein